jgi:hypothetical protein
MSTDPILPKRRNKILFDAQDLIQNKLTIGKSLMKKQIQSAMKCLELIVVQFVLWNDLKVYQRAATLSSKRILSTATWKNKRTNHQLVNKIREFALGSSPNLKRRREERENLKMFVEGWRLGVECCCCCC